MWTSAVQEELRRLRCDVPITSLKENRYGVPILEALERFRVG
jgi:hypothetical protein